MKQKTKNKSGVRNEGPDQLYDNGINAIGGVREGSAWWGRPRISCNFICLALSAEARPEALTGQRTGIGASSESHWAVFGKSADSKRKVNGKSVRS